MTVKNRSVVNICISTILQPSSGKQWVCVNYTHERIPRRIHCFRSSVACLNKQLFSKGAAGSFELRLGREKKAVTFEGAVNFGTPTQYAPGLYFQWLHMQGGGGGAWVRLTSYDLNQIALLCNLRFVIWFDVAQCLYSVSAIKKMPLRDSPQGIFVLFFFEYLNWMNVHLTRLSLFNRNYSRFCYLFWITKGHQMSPCAYRSGLFQIQ